jgi:hypothetical protein
MNISFRRLLHQETKKTLDNNTNSQKPFGNGSLPQVLQGNIEEEAHAFAVVLFGFAFLARLTCYTEGKKTKTETRKMLCQQKRV